MTSEFLTLRKESEDEDSVGYLSSIIFSPESFSKGQKHKFLTDSKPWTQIPPMSIITGKNGQGKSILLEYINHILMQNADGRGGSLKGILRKDPRQ